MVAAAILAATIDSKEFLIGFNIVLITFVLLGIPTYFSFYDEDRIGYAVFLCLFAVVCLSTTLFISQENIGIIQKYRSAKMAEDISVNEAGSITKANYIQFKNGFLLNQFSDEFMSYDIEFDTEEKRIYEIKEYFTAIPLVESEKDVHGEIFVWLICNSRGCGKREPFLGVGKMEDFFSALPQDDVYSQAIKKTSDKFGFVSAKSAIVITNMPRNFHLASEKRNAWKKLFLFTFWTFAGWVIIGIYPAYIEVFKLIIKKAKR